MPKFNSYLSTSTFITFVNSTSILTYPFCGQMERIIRITNFLSIGGNILSTETTPFSFHRKKEEKKTGKTRKE